MKVYKLNIQVKGFDGTGYKQAAEVTLDSKGNVMSAVPVLAKILAPQLRTGVVKGKESTLFADVLFDVVSVRNPGVAPISDAAVEYFGHKQSERCKSFTDNARVLTAYNLLVNEYAGQIKTINIEMMSIAFTDGSRAKVHTAKGGPVCCAY